MDLLIDFETRSEIDLRKVGPWVYSTHPTTEVLLLGFKVFDLKNDYAQDSEVLDFLNHDSPSAPARAYMHDSLYNLIINPSTRIYAHNAFFEQCILNNIILKDMGYEPLPPARFACTSAMSSAAGLPKKLSLAAFNLDLTEQKDDLGHRIMLKYCKPRPHYNKTGEGDKYFYEPDEYKRFIEYCRQDIDTEYELLKALPKLNKTERDVWILDQVINTRGVPVDRESAKVMSDFVETERSLGDTHIRKLTSNEVLALSQRDKLLGYINKHYELPDLTKATLDKYIASGDTPKHIKKILRLRANSSKSSTAKLNAFLLRSNKGDERVRGTLVYHGAHTGRWSGAGIQPQNFPRGSIKNTDLAFEILALKDHDYFTAIFHEPMEAISSMLRGLIKATPGKLLFAGDYSQIEVRVLWWLAQHDEGVGLFETGGKIYEDQAAVIYNKDVGGVTQDERQLGKAAILGCGYGMGKAKFYDTCLSWGMDIPKLLAEKAVDSYRQRHASVVRYWGLCEYTAIKAMANPGKIYTTYNISWCYKEQWLNCKLPSGRCLRYFKPMTKTVVTPWGEEKAALTYMTLNSYTRKYERTSTYGGKIVENITQAVARDIMAAAMLRLEDAGFPIIMTVHDEVISEASEDKSLDAFIDILKAQPNWALGCPIDADGFKSKRYRK